MPLHAKQPHRDWWWLVNTPRGYTVSSEFNLKSDSGEALLFLLEINLLFESLVPFAVKKRERVFLTRLNNSNLYDHS